LTYILYRYILISEVKETATRREIKMTTKKLRNIVKNNIIAQGGKLYGFNCNNIAQMHGVAHTEIQNAMNYFRYSPQQAKFRETYNFH